MNQPAPSAQPRARKSRFQRAGAPTAPTAEPEDQAAPAAASPPARPSAPAPEPPAAARVASAPSAEARPAAEPARAAVWDSRMSLTLSKEMEKALKLAKVDDGIEGTARIRAMIALWQEDDRLRKRIDKLARTLR